MGMAINDSLLDNVNQFKYLSVHITNTLSRNVHISNVCRKVGHSIEIVR